MLLLKKYFGKKWDFYSNGWNQQQVGMSANHGLMLSTKLNVMLTEFYDALIYRSICIDDIIFLILPFNINADPVCISHSCTVFAMDICIN